MESSGQSDKRRPIQLLPEHLIDQIKAGEVIERPSSLIKELLENAIDAQAKHLKIHIIDAGMELIQIEDDGIGMSFDELPFAFCRHATSKIERFEDIYNLSSYGFRGEALASLCSVARVTCVSSPKENPSQGGRLIVHGGETISHSVHSSDKSGTSFFIKDLFYNTPARLKFVKSKTSEKNSLKRILKAFLLSSPQVNFTIRWDDEDKQFFPAVDQNDPKVRMAQVLLKSKKVDDLICVDEQYEDHRIIGYLSKNSSRGSAHKQQFFFANQRLFFDKSLHQLINRSMEKVWGPGESGDYCFFIIAPPSQIDVNVHPHKTQIKFFKSSLVYSLLSGMLKKVQQTSPQKPLHALPSDLFNHEEYKELELNEMLSNTSQHEQNYGSSLFESKSEHGQAELNQFLILEKSFFIHRDAQKQYLVSYQRYLSELLQENLIDKIPLNENETTPLLISEPFKIRTGQIDKYIAELKSFGLEIDRLDPHTVVLRAIPRIIESLNYRLIVGELCLHLNTSSQKDLSAMMTTFVNQGMPNLELNASSVQLLTSSFNPANRGVKEIDRDLLERIFS